MTSISMASVSGASLVLAETAIGPLIQELSLYTIGVPVDPFVLDGKLTHAAISVNDLRHVFADQVYTPQLKPFLAARFKAGQEVLEHSALSVVLLSGGSANFGWLKELLRRDFAEYLEGVQFVQVSDYQQVVAQGLAVDCAREFATGSGIRDQCGGLNVLRRTCVVWRTGYRVAE